MQDLFIEFLPPWVETGLQPAFYDRESGTVIQQTARMYAKVNELVKAVNGMDKVIKEYVDYIDHYFENLDVQEEINNKLDDMAESGDLAEFIALYANLPCVHAYATIADMASSENLADGSYARAMSKTVAGTGDGFYYKIRETVEGDDPDGENLVTITGTTLVAEKIPDAFMNDIAEDLEEVTEQLEDEIDYKYNKGSEIKLQNYLTYDMANTYYSQGSTIDENGTVYVYKSNTSYNGGEVLTFNKVTETMSGAISVNFYHGNGMLAKGNYLYVAPAKSNDKQFIVYNLNTGVTTSNTSLSGESAYSTCISVCDYDTNNIMVTLGQEGYNANVLGVAPYIFNLTDNSFTKITFTNSKNFKIDDFLALQSVTYKDGHIYVLMSQPNCVLDFLVDGNSADLQRIYQIPRRDLLGLTIGEVEQISVVPGTDYFMLSTHADENQALNSRTIKLYFLSFNSELPQFYHARTLTDSQSYFDLRYLDNSKTSLYENGSETYPFKSFTRAVESATHSTVLTGNQVRVKSGTYNVGRIYGANAVISLVDSDQVVEFNGGNREMKMGNCNFYIVTNEGSLTFNVPNSPYVIAIDDNSNISIRGLVTFKSTLEISAQSTVKIENGLFDYNNQSKNIRVIQGSNATIIVNSNSTHPSNPLFTLSSNSVLTTNTGGDTQFFDLGDQGPCWTKIMTGLHSADS